MRKSLKIRSDLFFLIVNFYRRVTNGRKIEEKKKLTKRLHYRKKKNSSFPIISNKLR